MAYIYKQKYDDTDLDTRIEELIQELVNTDATFQDQIMSITEIGVTIKSLQNIKGLLMTIRAAYNEVTE